MDKLKKIEGDLSARDLRIGIVATRFNDFIVDSLLRGASTRCCATAPARRTSRWCACPARGKCRGR
jgi:6,7-dimethyl-8-ribityllumazine synthase